MSVKKPLIRFGNTKVHMKTHSVDKLFGCNICDKTCALQWRLQKHIKGHTDQNIKFCHYFNNNLNCIFEETSGCMFRHEIAPVCKDSDKCKFKKCQFSHAVNEEHSDESNFEAEEFSSNLQEYSKCDFNSKC